MDLGLIFVVASIGTGCFLVFCVIGPLLLRAFDEKERIFFNFLVQNESPSQIAAAWQEHKIVYGEIIKKFLFRESDLTYFILKIRYQPDGLKHHVVYKRTDASDSYLSLSDESFWQGNNVGDSIQLFYRKNKPKKVFLYEHRRADSL